MTSLDHEWALAAEMQRMIRGETPPEEDGSKRHAAEGRWLAVDYVRCRIGAHVLAWHNYEREQREVFEHVDEHACMSATCSQKCLAPGTQFIDPLSGRPFTASGDVYLCCTTGAVHVCTPHECRLEAESAHDRGTTLCPVTGRFKAAMLASGESFREREARIADSRPPTYKRAVTREGNTKRQRRAVPDRSAHAHKDAVRICERLVHEGPVLAALQQRLAAADAEAVRVVARACDHRRVTSVRALTELLVEHYEGAKLSAVMRMEMMAVPLPADTAEYLARCVFELFQIVREMGPGKDANLRKLCVPLLYTMLHGLVGVVETCRATGRIMDRRVIADNGRAISSSDSGLVVRQWMFVPAHPWMGCLLPADNQALPEVAGWEDELANQMKRTRRVNQTFLDAIGDGTKDVMRFCLASRIPALRPHLAPS